MFLTPNFVQGKKFRFLNSCYSFWLIFVYTCTKTEGNRFSLLQSHKQLSKKNNWINIQQLKFTTKMPTFPANVQLLLGCGSKGGVGWVGEGGELMSSTN